MPRQECKREHVTLNAEHLAHWYLRLNGFMMIDNFVLHPDGKPWETRTDADIFGVRFPYRKELGFDDDTNFCNDQKPRFIIAEVTKGQCKINGPWTKPERENIQYVLNALGAFKQEDVEAVAYSLYNSYSFDNEHYMVSMIAFGKSINPELSGEGKHLIQIEFRDALSFIFDRFVKFRNEKREHQHWDRAGKTLWDLAEQNRDSVKSFIVATLSEFGIEFQ